MTESLWSATTERKPFPPLVEDGLHVDVAIVGGGITGVTAAILLQAAGKRVAILEARRMGSGVTGGTTAHLTEALDTRYYELESKFGREGAQLAATSTREAIELISELDTRFATGSKFERVQGFLFTERDEHVEEIQRELDAARRAGIAADLASPHLPIVVKAALRFENQAQFHPLSYISALCQALRATDAQIFEQTRVMTIDEGEPCRLHLENGVTLSADRVIVATHAPINKLMLHPKVAHYRSYVVSGPVEQAPHGLYWDTEDPYHYIRAQRIGGETHLIVGGADHKTGQEDHTEAHFERLHAYAARFGLHHVTHEWSAQVIEPVDGLPFIGQNAGSELVYVATGYSGNGMTFGTLAAMILSDACLGKANRYAELYSATRIKPLAALGSFIGENVDFPLHLLSDRLRPPNAHSLEEIHNGEGKIVRVGGERLAVYRDEHGRLHALSPVCTHLGCHVSFNDAEKTWDCPCHGSRFNVDGAVLDGPAVKPLGRKNLVE